MLPSRALARASSAALAGVIICVAALPRRADAQTTPDRSSAGARTLPSIDRRPATDAAARDSARDALRRATALVAMAKDAAAAARDGDVAHEIALTATDAQAALTVVSRDLGEKRYQQAASDADRTVTLARRAIDMALDDHVVAQHYVSAGEVGRDVSVAADVTVRSETPVTDVNIATSAVAERGGRRPFIPARLEPYGTVPIDIDSLPFGSVVASPGLAPLFVPQPTHARP